MPATTEVNRAVTEDVGEDDDFNPTAHANLIDNINSTTGSHFIRGVTRTEPSLTRSEFNLAKNKEGNVRLADLKKLISKKNKQPDLLKQLNKLKSAKTLDKPLEKPVADKLERQAGFFRVKQELAEWEPVVTVTDFAPQTVFPLQYGSLSVHNEPPKKVSEYRVKTKLMEAMEELDRKYAGTEAENGDSGAEEESPNYQLTLEEMRQKQRERAQQKLRESYRIARGRRMNKIKSKKYHRLLKKDKLRMEMKKFEELREKDPEEALRQLDRIEKQRFQERATLRHKNTGTWAKNLQVRAKYNMDVRRELADQLAIGRELTAKRMQRDESSSESDVELEVVEQEQNSGSANPWTPVRGEHEKAANQQTHTSGYRKYWEQRNRVQAIKTSMAAGEEEKRSSQEKEVDGDSGEDDAEIKQFKKKLVKSRGKKKKLATGGWMVSSTKEEDSVSEEQDPDDPKVVPKTKKKSNNVVASVETLFDEAEELIKDALEGKLQRIKGVNSSQQAKDTSKKKKVKKDPNRNKMGEDTGLSFKKKPRLADADIELHETTDMTAKESKTTSPTNVTGGQTVSGAPTPSADINLKQVVQMKPKHLLTALPDAVATGELSDGDDDPDDEAVGHQRLTIAEAFEDDDIVADFVKEKQDERDKNIPQEVNLSMPGWGEWAGPGVKPSRKPRKVRKIFKPPAELPRRDDNKDQVIINEDALVNDKLKKHLINDLPFPYVTVKDFEASLRAPIGRSFIPESAHVAMIEPRVVTRQGAIIEPMKKDLLLSDPKRLMRVRGKQANGATEQYGEFIKTFNAEEDRRKAQRWAEKRSK
ncbi:U3 small nucleolar RNA-associated protein 14 homolog A [Anopheles bellator]|uniref:U3 small nucleolar RNA-associated protein 14 homolog A n=1 Tax=Anopheles bellator TaxID=139047 RepID=UPI002649DF07|nr:U3 small nucleolar RNA-associated protein 14 homolog A [Anopheles bellator]